MFNFKIKLHRNYLPANVSDQKLFILLQIDSEKNAYLENNDIFDVYLNISLVKNVKINRISGIYPMLTEIALSSTPFFIGKINTLDAYIFLIEMAVPEHKPGRVKLSEIYLTYNSDKVKDVSNIIKTPYEELIVEYVSGNNSQIYGTDKEVMHYIQQRNICFMIEQAENEVAKNANKAIDILKSAMKTATVINNTSMTMILDKAIKDIEYNKASKNATLKTLKTDVKTHTVRFNKNIFTDEEIKKITGV